jgi:hypothetical protein
MKQAKMWIRSSYAYLFLRTHKKLYQRGFLNNQVLIHKGKAVPVTGREGP